MTPEYVLKRISPKRQFALHHPLAFGKGLTDGTYLDWILYRSQKLFLILEGIGCADHIFEALDKAYYDEDLPLGEDAVEDLALGSSALGKKFLRLQGAFNVQELEEGSHVDYGDDDVIPVEPVPKVAKTGASTSKVDRVVIKNKVYMRRRMSLGGEREIEKAHFVLHFKSLQKLRHPHLLSVWATYTHQNQGYILLDPAREMTLKSFLEDLPKNFRHLSKSAQCETILKWIHCLSSAVAYLHANRYAHQAIRPSNTFVDSNLNIYLGAYAAMGALEDREPAYEKDTYENAAPEEWQRKATLQETNPLRSTLQSGGRTGQRIKRGHKRRPSWDSYSSHSNQSGDNSPAGRSRVNSQTTTMTIPTGDGRSSRLTSRSGGQPGSVSSSSSYTANSCRPSHTIITTLTHRRPSESRTLFDQTPYFPSDIFSLAVTNIQLLSLLASIAQNTSKLSPASLRSHLGKHNRTAGRGGAPADSSFHANLRQVTTWLDLLEHAAEARKPSVLKMATPKFRSSKSGSAEGKGGSPGAAEDDPSARFRGALGSLTAFSRRGVAREPRERLSAYHSACKIERILARWDIALGPCCASGAAGGAHNDSGSDCLSPTSVSNGSHSSRSNTHSCSESLAPSVVTTPRMPRRRSDEEGGGWSRNRGYGSPGSGSVSSSRSSGDGEFGFEGVQWPLPSARGSGTSLAETGGGSVRRGAARRRGEADDESVVIALEAYGLQRPRTSHGAAATSRHARFGGISDKYRFPPRDRSRWGIVGV